MTVAEVSALLYSPGHARERLERALRIEALSPGWRSSFEALLKAERLVMQGSCRKRPRIQLHRDFGGSR